MNMKTVIPLALALILGLLAAFLVKNAMAHRNAPSASNANTVAVVVAKLDIEPGKALDKEDLALARVPAEFAPTNVFSDPNQLVGRVPITPLSRGQTIMETLLASSGSGSGLQALVPPGMRAFTIEVNQFTGVGGMLEPGCRVDVIGTLSDPKTRENMSKTVLQNIKILAIGRSTTPPHPVEGQPAPPPANDVTLLVTPKQAQLLELACAAARPWLVLRYNKDGAEVELENTGLAELRGDKADDSGSQPSGIATATPTPAPTPTVANPFTPVADTTVQEKPTTYRRTITVIENGVERQETLILPLPHTDSADTIEQAAPANGR
jgi:pilus assembly protein CpaB